MLQKLQLFLFEKVAVVTRPSSQGPQVYRQPIPVTHLVVEDLPDGEIKIGSFRNAFGPGQTGEKSQLVFLFNKIARKIKDLCMLKLSFNSLWSMVRSKNLLFDFTCCSDLMSKEISFHYLNLFFKFLITFIIWLISLEKHNNVAYIAKYLQVNMTKSFLFLFSSQECFEGILYRQ